MTRRFFKGGEHAGALSGGRAVEHLVRETPSFWLAELARLGRVDPAQAASARSELDRRERAAHETMCTFLDRLSSCMSDDITLVERAA